MSNLSNEMNRALKKLKKRCKKEGIIIARTDKSGRFCVMKKERYIRAGAKHTEKDRMIDMQEVRERQKVLNGHARWITEALNIGASHGEKAAQRCRQNMIEEGGEVPAMVLLIKDHKKNIKEDPPPTRPVVAGNAGINRNLSNLISTILDPIASRMEGSAENNSTDDLLNKIDEMNKKKEEVMRVGGGEEEKDRGKSDIQHKTIDVVIGADVTALYPSLDVEKSAKICEEEVINTIINYHNVDWEYAMTYLKITMSEKELEERGLSKYAPERKGKRGQNIGVKARPDLSKWNHPKGAPTRQEIKKMVGAMTKVAIETVMRNHVYAFNGVVFVQESGGPIGLECTCSIAKVVMGVWDRRIKKRLRKLGLSIRGLGRYVDDVRIFMRGIREEYRYDKGKDAMVDQEGGMVEAPDSEVREAEDKKRRGGRGGEAGTPQEIEDIIRHTSKQLEEIFNNEIGFLNFEMESQLDFESGSLPTLDTDLYTTGDGKIRYRYYEKPMATNVVLQRQSAMSDSMKRATLVEEVVRRMRNTSVETEVNHKIGILEGLVVKMERSGYSDEYMGNIMKEGLTKWEIMKWRSNLERDHEDYRPLHLGRWFKTRERRKKKMMAKSTWYKEKPNNVNNKIESEINKPKYKPWGQEKKRDEGEEKDGEDKRGSKLGEKEKEREPDTVMFVPWTVNSELVNLLKEVEKTTMGSFNTKVRMVEKAGTQLWKVLAGGGSVIKDCEREECEFCKDKKRRGKCITRGTIYISRCVSCKKKGVKEGIYIGETARTIFERMEEHAEDYEKCMDKSHRMTHWAKCHKKEEEPEFEVEIMTTRRSPLERQVREAVMIRDTCPDLNGKQEFGMNSVENFIIDTEDMEREERVRKEEEEMVKQFNKIKREEREKDGRIKKRRRKEWRDNIEDKGGKQAKKRRIEKREGKEENEHNVTEEENQPPTVDERNKTEIYNTNHIEKDDLERGSISISIGIGTRKEVEEIGGLKLMEEKDKENRDNRENMKERERERGQQESM